MFLTLFFSAQLISRNAFAQEANYSAMVLSVMGDVTVQQDGGKAKAASLAIGEMLYPRDVVETKKSSQVVIGYIASGQEETWPENMKFSVGSQNTENIPENVLVKKVEVALPEWEGPDHMGGQVLQSVRPAEDPDALDKALDQGKDGLGEYR